MAVERLRHEQMHPLCMQQIDEGPCCHKEQSINPEGLVANF